VIGLVAFAQIVGETVKQLSSSTRASITSTRQLYNASKGLGGLGGEEYQMWPRILAAFAWNLSTPL